MRVIIRLPMNNKKSLSERDIITKYILPSIEQSGWNKQTQLKEEVSFTAGRIFVKGKKTKHGERKRADIIIYYKPNIPVAVVEAKDNNHTVGAGMQQAEINFVLDAKYKRLNGDETDDILLIFLVMICISW
ncbi:MAG: hypothetical protein MJ196_06450 [Treponemataceae bacterium]|nr:hypothetical protein [Treponemataceae bacterium]